MSESIISAADVTKKTAARTFDASIKQITGTVGQAQAGYEKTREEAQAQMHTGIERSMHLTQEFTGLMQGHMAAMQQSIAIWTSGMQEFAKSATEFAKAAFEEAAEVSRNVAASRSVKDAVALQSNYVRVAMDKAVAEMTRTTDATLKLAERATAPVTARVTATTETLGHALAQGQ